MLSSTNPAGMNNLLALLAVALAADWFTEIIAHIYVNSFVFQLQYVTVYGLVYDADLKLLIATHWLQTQIYDIR